MKCIKCRKPIQIGVTENIEYSIKNNKFKVRHIKCTRRVQRNKSPIIGRFIGYDLGGKTDKMAMIELSSPRLDNKSFFYKCYERPIKLLHINTIYPQHLVEGTNRISEFEREYNCKFTHSLRMLGDIWTMESNVPLKEDFDMYRTVEAYDLDGIYA